jgi:hypothetical protein
MSELGRGTGSITDPEYLDFVEGNIIQAAEINEMQSVSTGRMQRLGNLFARDGDPQSGCDIRLNGTSLTLDAGTMYINGDVRQLAARTITIALTGTVRVGVRLTYETTTSDENPALLGQVPDTNAYGEPGADRRKGLIAWYLESETATGEFFPVYTIIDGQIQTRLAPPELTGIAAVVGRYDFDVNGNYAVAEGLRVLALGRTGTAQHFSISEGTANVNGVKRIIPAGRRHIEPESFDTEAIADSKEQKGPDISNNEHEKSIFFSPTHNKIKMHNANFITSLIKHQISKKKFAYFIS